MCSCAYVRGPCSCKLSTLTWRITNVFLAVCNRPYRRAATPQYWLLGVVYDKLYAQIQSGDMIKTVSVIVTNSNSWLLDLGIECVQHIIHSS